MPSLTVAEALGSMPSMIGTMLGDRALQRSLTVASLPENISDQVGTYIPEIALDRFLDHAARQAGDDLFGLHLAPHLSVKEYGVWGEYVLEAPTLLSALRRAISIIHLHADNDRLALRQGSQTTKLKYAFAERSGRGYKQIALAALGPMLSVPRHFLGRSWCPLSIELDLGDRLLERRIESGLQTRVRSDRDRIAIEIPNDVLGARNPRRPTAQTTVHDVVRACAGGPPSGIVSVVKSLILQRLGNGQTTLDDIARGLGTSGRTLQRRLDQQGTDFRRIVNAVRMRRASELLTGSSTTVSEIGLQLDYATGSHFARAFKKAHGVSPGEFRALRSIAED